MCTTTEAVIMLPLERLVPFPDHPFYVREDERMDQLIRSIAHVGVLTPIVVRESGNGMYQIISGHRRKLACEKLGISAIPAIVRNLEDDTAIVTMVDSNLQREEILPSEKARAYKMKLDAIKHQGARTDLTSDSNLPKKRRIAREIIAENSPDGAAIIQRYIRLTRLIPALPDMVDRGTITITPAFELTFLNEEEQKDQLITIESEQVTPSVSQAMRMKQLAKSGLLTADMILAIMSEKKKSESWNLTLPMNRVARYFPSNYTAKKMQDVIFQLLDRWMAIQIKNQSGKR